MAPGEPRPSPKPQPIGSIFLGVVITLCTLAIIVVLWRKADSLRTVFAHQLRTWTGREGAVRLSTDEGPSAHEFLRDDDEDDDEDNENARADDNEPLAERALRLKQTDALP